MVDKTIRLGDISFSPDADKLLNKADVKDALTRHQRGDWGEIGVLQRLENERNLRSGNGWIQSRFRDRNGTYFILCTKHYTTVTLAG